MKYPDLLRAAVLAAATLGVGSVLAQTTAPSQTTPALNTQIVSDVAPPPAEDRASTGALVVAPVRAQRARGLTSTMGAGPALKPISRRAGRSKVEKDLEQTRLEQAMELQRRGAAGLEAN
jgi:hypothetical protein